MEYMNKNIVEIHEALKAGKVTSEELIEESLRKSKIVQEKCNAFVTIIDDAKGIEVTDNFLSGIPYGVKDNYSTKGILTTASSNTLKDYVPFFDATVIEKLNEAGAVAVNKTALDEFGMGGSGITPHTGVVKNPWDQERISGGSSAGSAVAVSSGVYPYALGSDTGDSIRKPAAFCGIVGYKPTYGLISRFGLLPYASSIDHCGVLTRCVEDAAIVVDVTKGKDEKDMTSLDSSHINLYKCLSNEIKNKKLCYIKEICDLSFYPNPTEELKKHLGNFMEVVNKCREIGYEVDEVSIDEKLLQALPQVYNVIAYAEATSNMSNLTGIIFGPRGKGDNIVELMKDHRTNGFSSLIKRRFIIGSFVLQKENQEKYFVNAQRVRRLLVDAWKKMFEIYSAVIMPVSAGPAKYLDNSKNVISEGTEVLEEHLQIANFGGFPSITIPCGYIDNLPVGVNLTSDIFNDELVLQIAYRLEEKLGYKNIVAGEVR